MSVHQHIGRRLLRNKGAVFGLIIIGAALFIAITAYFISPDSTPDANRMIVEIGGRKPGFRQQFLLLHRGRSRTSPSFFQPLLSGATDQHTYIPINSYTPKMDSLIVEKYVD